MLRERKTVFPCQRQESVNGIFLPLKFRLKLESLVMKLRIAFQLRIESFHIFLTHSCLPLK